MRFLFGIIYIAIGILMIGFNQPSESYVSLKDSDALLSSELGFNLEWALSWATFGVGAWLISSRDHKYEMDSNFWHYLFYFPFAILVSTLGAYAIAIYLSSEPNISLKFYSMSSFLALIFGFQSENLKNIPLSFGKFK